MSGGVVKRWSAVAAQQYGLLTRVQAYDAGLTRRQVDWLLKKGSWQAVHPGVFRSAAAPVMWPQAAMAASLWGAGSVAVSHRTAARLWELDGPWGNAVEVSGTSSLPPPAGVVYHQVRKLGRADLETRRGIRVTSVARTLLDLAGVVSERVLERALDEALRRRLVQLEHVEWCIERNGRRGRRGVATLASMLDERRYQAPNDSPLETDVAAVFRRAGLPAPTRNHDVVVGGRRLARVDLAWVRERVAVQVHSAYHRQPRNWERDQVVENELSACGWLVVKVTKAMLDRDRAGVIALVKRALSERG